MGNYKLIAEEEILKQEEYIRLIKQQCQGKTLYALVETYGCQQNESDSEKIKGMLEDMGYIITHDRAVADIIIFNTCAVRENAEQKIFGNIGALKNLKLHKPSMIIGVCGCMPEQPHITEAIKKKYPFVDFVFGTKNIHKLPENLYKVITTSERVFDFADDGYIAEGLPIKREGKSKAFVSIMYGCNNFCTYCIVPHTRGRERSRRPDDIIAEVKGLVENGYKDIMLLGQNVNSYGKDIGELDFAGLLRRIDAIEGDYRIRFMTSHPKDVSDALIDAIAECKHVVKHVHLPFQAGSDRILRLMNRRYTKEQYLNLIEKLRSKVPGITFSSDVIVGFPTETYEDFLETLDIVKKVRFDSLFMFLFSKRKGTPAAEMEGQVPDDEKSRRFTELASLQEAISAEINQRYLGKRVKVLVEGPSKKNPEVLTGRDEHNKVINFEGPKGLEDVFCEVEITQTQSWSLTGKYIGMIK